MTTETWLVAGAIGLGLWVLVWALVRDRRSTSDAGLGLLQQQLEALRTQLQQALASQGSHVGQELARLTAQVSERLREGGDLAQRSQASLGERLDHATRVVGEVQRGLGELKEATARVHDVGKDVASLHDILRAPKLRGGLGELLLADLLGQVLPAANFDLQHGFPGGERVDAVVRLGDGLVPIDAKFPLEDFRRLLDADESEDRARLRRAFVARVRRHVDDIAGKYIRPDVGTYDFALMYIPAENVYYETIIRDDESSADRGLAGYALERKVVPVSPNCLYAYLQAIALGLRGLRIESRAAEMVGQLDRLRGEIGRLRDEIRLLGRHLGNAGQVHAAADRRLDRLEGRLTTIIGDEDATSEDPTPRSVGGTS